MMRSFFLILSLYTTAGFPGQVERYDRKFFIQLRGIFGRFRDSDLQRAFENAHPIQCAELVNNCRGETRGEGRNVVCAAASSFLIDSSQIANLATTFRAPHELPGLEFRSWSRP